MLTVAENLNSLTICANENKNISNFWGCTKSELHETKYTWAIDNFSFLTEKNDREVIRSPLFTLALPDQEMDLCLVLYPKRTNAPHLFGIQLQAVTQNIGIHVKIELGVINRNREEVDQHESKEKLVFLEHGVRSILFHVNRSRLTDESDDFFLEKDRLIVYCKISAVCKIVPEVKNEIQIKENSFSEGIKELFESKMLSDFSLLVDGIEIRAHRFVLSVRCPVLRALLADKTTAKLEINDISYEAVNEFLRYIYTGEIENIDKFPEELLLASIKYKMKGLQAICCENIISNMDPKSSVDWFLIAHHNQIDELKDKTSDFIQENTKAILETDWFNKMKEKDLRLILDVVAKNL